MIEAADRFTLTRRPAAASFRDSLTTQRSSWRISPKLSAIGMNWPAAMGSPVLAQHPHQQLLGEDVPGSQVHERLRVEHELLVLDRASERG